MSKARDLASLASDTADIASQGVLAESAVQPNDDVTLGVISAERGIGDTETDTSVSGTYSVSFDTYQNFVLTLTGNLTINNTNFPSQEGQSGFIVFKQDATGSRTVSLGSGYKTAGAAGLTLSGTANAIDIVPYIFVSSTECLLGTPQLAFA